MYYSYIIFYIDSIPLDREGGLAVLLDCLGDSLKRRTMVKRKKRSTNQNPR